MRPFRPDRVLIRGTRGGAGVAPVRVLVVEDEVRMAAAIERGLDLTIGTSPSHRVGSTLPA